MNAEQYERWKREYGEREVPGGFSDRVMERIEHESCGAGISAAAHVPASELVARKSQPSKSSDGVKNWRSLILGWSLVSAASLVACLRIVQVLWVFSS